MHEHVNIQLHPWHLLGLMACLAGMVPMCAGYAAPSPTLAADVKETGGASARPASDAKQAELFLFDTLHLSNGMTIAVAPLPGQPTFTATIHYKVGSAREWQGLLGATEIVGRLLLDGTPTLGTRNRQREKTLLYRLDRVDAQIRALASEAREGSGQGNAAIVARLARQRSRLIAELEAISSSGVMAQLYRDRGADGPTVSVTPTEVQVQVTLPTNQLSYFFAMEATRQAGLATRNFYVNREALAAQRAEDFADPGFLLMQGLVADAYHVHPFGRYRADPDSIRGIARGELEYYYRQYFKPSQTIVAIAGGVDVQTVRRLSWRYLAGLPFRGPPAGRLEPVEPHQQGERRLYVGAGDHVEILMAFHLDAANVTAGDPVLPVLLELLRDRWLGTFAPLWTPQQGNHVTDRVLATVYPPSPPLGASYPSLLVIGARATGATTSSELEHALRDRLNALMIEAPPDTALDAARNRARRVLAEHLTRTAELSSMLARTCATTGDVQALETFFKGIHEVTADRIREVAANLFARSNATVAIMAPGRQTTGSPPLPKPPPAPDVDNSATPGPREATASPVAHQGNDTR